MDGQSIDIKQTDTARLRKLFPGIFSEDKIDLEKFKAAFGGDIDSAPHNERYTLNWAGKADAYRILQERTAATLKPQPKLSVNFDTAENVFIEGENLEVLKVLQKSYYGKVKCIIIDPPYNTGNDSFIYPDRFKENLEEYEKRVGERDEGGYLMKEGLFRKNSKENGHYHSNWLSMMLPRLFLTRNLMRDDGVIFVHIDDNEVHNLRLLMNEIFGEENFAAQIIWQKVYSPRMDVEGFSNSHDYILCYVKSRIDSIKKEGFQQNSAQFNFVDPKTKKNYRRRSVRKEGSHSTRSERPNLFFALTAPDGTEIYPIKPDGTEGCWRWSMDTYIENLNLDLVEWVNTDNGWQVYAKQFLDENATKPPETLWFHNEVSHNHNAMEELKKILNGKLFDSPKPKELIIKMLKIATTENSWRFRLYGGKAHV